MQRESESLADDGRVGAAADRSPGGDHAAGQVPGGERTAGGRRTTRVVASRVSERKLAANRANALRSTGPKPPAEKLNALLRDELPYILGFVAVWPGDDTAALTRLAVELVTPYLPIEPIERCRVGMLVNLSWRSRRIAKAEQTIAARLFVEQLRRYPAATREAEGAATPAVDSATVLLADVLGKRELATFGGLQTNIARQIQSLMKSLEQGRKVRDACARAALRRKAKQAKSRPDAAPAGD